jgi:hypothetical protein
MRDIRSDLRERLGSIEQDRERLKASIQRQLEELDQMEIGVKALLDQEERRFAASNGSGNGHAADDGTTPLARLIISLLKNSPRPLTVDEFKTAAATARFDFGEKSPGRVIHWGLVGMQQGGIVEKKGGRWQLKEVTQ